MPVSSCYKCEIARIIIAINVLGELGEDAEIMVTIGMISFRNYSCLLTMPMIHSYTGAVLVGSCGFFVCCPVVVVVII